MRAFCAVALFLYSSAALAQDWTPYTTGERFNGVYLCRPEISGGLRFNGQSSQWEHGAFRLRGNFLPTVGPISRDKVSVFGGEVDAMTYNVSRSEPGQKEAISAPSRETKTAASRLERTASFVARRPSTNTS